MWETYIARFKAWSKLCRQNRGGPDRNCIAGRTPHFYNTTARRIEARPKLSSTFN
jgi:hypothetical protein